MSARVQGPQRGLKDRAGNGPPPPASAAALRLAAKDRGARGRSARADHLVLGGLDLAGHAGELGSLPGDAQIDAALACLAGLVRTCKSLGA